MMAVRIKVVRRALHEDLAKAYGGQEIRPCEALRDGQEFVTSFAKPEGLCDWAWNDISRGVFALLTGGSFDRGVFRGWMKDGSSLVACCTDGFRPVSFLLERIDTASLLDLSTVSRPAPRDVYASERWGEFGYELAGLEPGARCLLRLHFAEIYFSGPGRRVFHVEVNGARVIEGLDVFAEAGGAHRALVREVEAAADATGKVTLRFVKGAADLPKIGGIELFTGGADAPRLAINCGGPAVGGFSPDAHFVGGNTTGG
jgi:uncharacterized repeat protein (TIGR04076 family)